MATNNIINLSDLQSIFFAYPSAQLSLVTGDNTKYKLAMNSELYDVNGDYNNATYAYTAPVTGNYFLQCSLSLSGITANHTDCILYIEPTGKSYISSHLNLANAVSSSANAYAYSNIIVALTVGDSVTFSLQVSSTNKTINIRTLGSSNPLSWIAGYLLR